MQHDLLVGGITVGVMIGSSDRPKRRFAYQALGHLPIRPWAICLTGLWPVAVS
jgi:DNA repair exonuclease SbcCD nuclease subunit